jgi:hypothetical protein
MTTTTEAEILARRFAATYPTDSVLAAVAHCEAGTLAWVDVAALFARSYGTARRRKTDAERREDEGDSLDWDEDR